MSFRGLALQVKELLVPRSGWAVRGEPGFEQIHAKVSPFKVHHRFAGIPTVLRMGAEKANAHRSLSQEPHEKLPPGLAKPAALRRKPETLERNHNFLTAERQPQPVRFDYGDDATGGLFGTDKKQRIVLGIVLVRCRTRWACRAAQAEHSDQTEHPSQALESGHGYSLPPRRSSSSSPRGERKPDRQTGSPVPTDGRPTRSAKVNRHARYCPLSSRGTMNTEPSKLASPLARLQPSRSLQPRTAPCSVNRASCLSKRSCHRRSCGGSLRVAGRPASPSRCPRLRLPVARPTVPQPRRRAAKWSAQEFRIGPPPVLRGLGRTRELWYHLRRDPRRRSRNGASGPHSRT